MGEAGVGGCTLTEHRVQPWHASFPHKPLLPPQNRGAFSRGAAAQLQLKLLFLHARPPYLSRQAFPAPFLPGGSGGLTKPLQAHSSPVSLCKILHLQLPAAGRGEVQVYIRTVCCLQSWRDLLTLNEGSAPVSR